jgi:hydrogenase nickel incorporation protein HypA/HybF
MHELSITKNIIAIVEAKAQGRRVQRVKLVIGKLSGIEPTSIRFCYDLCSAGTLLQQSELEIDEIEGRGECQKCNRSVELEVPLGVCPCPERGPLAIVQGNELLVKEMEVA